MHTCLLRARVGVTRALRGRVAHLTSRSTAVPSSYVAALKTRGWFRGFGFGRREKEEKPTAAAENSSLELFDGGDLWLWTASSTDNLCGDGGSNDRLAYLVRAVTCWARAHGERRLSLSLSYLTGCSLLSPVSITNSGFAASSRGREDSGVLAGLNLAPLSILITEPL